MISTAAIEAEAIDGEGAAARLLLIFAHPDDESFGCAGTMAAASARGIPVTLICATRGEAGKTGDPTLDTPEVLGAVREQELRAAAKAVGVADIRFLDYRDSGMAGTPENDDPRAFCQAPEAEVVAKLVVHLRALRPTTVLTFGPDGIYGHPDHLAIHRATVAAITAAADPTYRPSVGPPWRVPAVYFNAAPRERLLAMADRPNSPLRDLPVEQRATLGTPLAEITTIIDIAAHAETKRRAIAAHRTQTGDGGPLASMPPEAQAAFLSQEYFVRVPQPRSEPTDGTRDVLAALAATFPGRRPDPESFTGAG